jgi:hypothetical protein
VGLAALLAGFLIGGTAAWYKGWDEGFREGYKVETTKTVDKSSRLSGSNEDIAGIR